MLQITPISQFGRSKVALPVPGTMKDAIEDRVVRFSSTSVLVVLLHSNMTSFEARWYCKDDLESFKSLFEISVAEIRVQFSRGGVDALTTNEILGLEKKLTREVSEQSSLKM